MAPISGKRTPFFFDYKYQIRNIVSFLLILLFGALPTIRTTFDSEFLIFHQFFHLKWNFCIEIQSKNLLINSKLAWMNRGRSLSCSFALSQSQKSIMFKSTARCHPMGLGFCINLRISSSLVAFSYGLCVRLQFWSLQKHFVDKYVIPKTIIVPIRYRE